MKPAKRTVRSTGKADRCRRSAGCADARSPSARPRELGEAIQSRAQAERVPPSEVAERILRQARAMGWVWASGPIRSPAVVVTGYDVLLDDRIHATVPAMLLARHVKLR